MRALTVSRNRRSVSRPDDPWASSFTPGFPEALNDSKTRASSLSARGSFGAYPGSAGVGEAIPGEATGEGPPETGEELGLDFRKA